MAVCAPNAIFRPHRAMSAVLPVIPAKRYFTIGEVSYLCAVKAHVLRYWEQEFVQLRPVKRRGNRRYYQHHEVLLVRRIRQLLYDEGFTISGARNRLTSDEVPPWRRLTADSREPSRNPSAGARQALGEAPEDARAPAAPLGGQGASEDSPVADRSAAADVADRRLAARPVRGPRDGITDPALGVLRTELMAIRTLLEP